MRSHQAWLVDLDGTLYHPGPLKVAMATELLLFGVHHAPLLRRFRHEHERLRGGGTGSYPNPYAAQVGRTAEACGKSTEAVERIVREWMQERPGKWIYRFRRTGLLRQIAAYRAAGGRTAVVSDYPARRKLEALKLSELFDVVVACGEDHGPHALKPDPTGYLRAAELLGVRPEHCLVIGDRADADGAAARAAGMTFLRVR